MAQPRYMICAADRVIDQASGLASHFNVIDRIVVFAMKANSTEQQQIAPMPGVKVFCTAVWSRGAEDKPSDEFSYELLLKLPDGELEKVNGGTFRFLKKHYRIETAFLFGHHKIAKAGEIVVKCQVRKAGSEDWLAQIFSFDVEVDESITPTTPPVQVQPEPHKST